MVIKGFFFDLDGTLVDTHRSNFLAYRHAVEAVSGIALGDELLTRIKAGENSDSFLTALLPTATAEEVAAINKKKKELYSQYLDSSQANVYLIGFLRQMSKQHITALVTTAKRGNAQAVLRQHDIEDCFTLSIFGDDVTSMKPDPQAYNRALEEAGLFPGEAVAFEDSDKGIAAAEAAGITVVRIRNFL